MKKSYKLLGVEWDHYKLPYKLPIFIEKRNVADYSLDYNLFDLEQYERCVNISEVLSSTPDLLMEVIDKIKNCDCIYINIDYEPVNTSRDVISFYYLRVIQAIAFFETNLEENKIVVMSSQQAKKMCLEKWNDLYKINN